MTISVRLDDETRRLLLLQNAAFLPLFRGAMGGRGRVGEQKIEELAAAVGRLERRVGHPLRSHRVRHRTALGDAALGRAGDLGGHQDSGEVPKVWSHASGEVIVPSCSR